MEYQVIDVTGLPVTPGRDADRRSVSEAADLSNLALNAFAAEPGEAIPLAYHYHDEQEEAFYVLEGELHVETPKGEYVVGTDEAFLADPESPHRAYNPADATGTARVLAIGAPSVDDVHPYEPDDD